MGSKFVSSCKLSLSPQTSFAFREWDTCKPLHTNPSLDYLAPEYILTKSCGTLSDVFSYGMLAYTLYNGGKPLFENSNNMLSFKQNVEQVRAGDTAKTGNVDLIRNLQRMKGIPDTSLCSVKGILCNLSIKDTSL